MSQLKLSRREALAAMGALAVSAGVGTRAAVAQTEGKAVKGIALQLYTLRDPAKQDLAGTLKKVRDMGWEYVQWSGMPGLPAEQIREALDTAGLTAVSAHVGIEPFETDFDNQVAFWQTVGNKDVAPGGMMRDCQDSLESWKRGAARLDAVGAKLRGVGMRLSYHNHDHEFKTFDGDNRTKMDILMDETSPENLFAEVDTAWVGVAGVDPAEYLLKVKGRCPVIHVKDFEGGKRLGRVRFCAVGKGDMKWDKVFPAANEAGVEWYVYEQDSTTGDIFEDAKASFEFMSKNVIL